jgi:hypothetical protein
MAGLPSPLRILRPSRPRHLRQERLHLSDGARTTLHVASYDAAAYEVGVVRLGVPAPLEAWCRSRGIAEAIVGGFFVRPGATPLGEVRTRGVRRSSVPFDAPWDRLRACVHVSGGELRLARRHEIAAEPAGDLLQAGPMLLSGGVPVLAGDPEGFCSGARQFDSDITDGRHPRAAIATDGRRILAVACDGRDEDEAGLTLVELACALVDLGAVDALNLDGGGSTSLVCEGELRNAPRESFGVPIPGGRPVTTALVFRPR